jgi:glutamate dehydrogenase (NADP+)
LKYNSLNEFLDYVKTRDEHQPEFLQAVEEVMTSLWPFIEKILVMQTTVC